MTIFATDASFRVSIGTFDNNGAKTFPSIPECRSEILQAPTRWRMIAMEESGTVRA
jgi:hypothetical protein